MSSPAQGSKRQHRPAGFTLVELQVALLVMTLIALLLASALRSTAQAWDRSTDVQDTAEHRFLVDQFLRRHLNNMRFYRFQLEDVGSVASFIGERQAVYFVAPHPALENDGMLYWWTLKNRWNDDLDHNELILEYMPYSSQVAVDYRAGRGLTIEDIEPAEIVIDSKLEIVEFAFFIKDTDGLEGWEREVEPGRQVPTVVDLRLRTVGPGASDGEIRRIGVAPRYANQQLNYQGIESNG